MLNDSSITPPKKQSECYVYLMYCPKLRRTKIGISIFPEVRLRQIQRNNPYPIELRESLKCGSIAEARELERELHRRFAPLRVIGEWFDTTPECVLEMSPEFHITPKQERFVGYENVGLIDWILFNLPYIVLFLTLLTSGGAVIAGLVFMIYNPGFSYDPGFSNSFRALFWSHFLMAASIFFITIWAMRHDN